MSNVPKENPQDEIMTSPGEATYLDPFEEAHITATHTLVVENRTTLKVRKCRLTVPAGPDQTKELVSDKERIRIGAHSSNDLVLAEDRTASRHHFEIQYTERGYLYSQTADQESQKQLAQKRKSPAAAAAGKQCAPTDIAKTWLAALDGAIAKGDAQAIIAMFAADVAVRANIKEKGGKLASVDLGREELAQSTIAAMKGLKDYKQRRVWTDARLTDLAGGDACDRISLRSVVVEQGKQSGKAYRFESLEQYSLELRSGKWIAVKAETTQQ